MKIVILDGHALNPGDLDWAPLREQGEVVIYPRSAPSLVAARIAEADVVVVNKVRLSAAHFEAARCLKMVAVTATGTDNIELEAAARAGVTVCNVPSYSAGFTAQTAIALLLELTHRTGLHAAAVRAGDWENNEDFSFWRAPLVDLEGKTMVVLGMGTIGSKVARIAVALGMRVVAGQLPGRSGGDDWDYLPLDDALKIADVISLHCPLTAQTRGLVNAEFLAKVKTGALLINTARGAILNEAEVANALENGVLGGLGADVLSVEPPPPHNPLLRAKNSLITPHLGWASLAARERCLAVTLENVRAFARGEVQNRVN